MNQEMIKGLYSVISPSNSNKYNELNPFRSKKCTTQKLSDHTSHAQLWS